VDYYAKKNLYLNKKIDLYDHNKSDYMNFYNMFEPGNLEISITIGLIFIIINMFILLFVIKKYNNISCF